MINKSGLKNIPINMQSAHLNYDITRFIPQEIRDEIRKNKDKWLENPEIYINKNYPTATEIIFQTIKDETGLNPTKELIKYSNHRARISIERIIDKHYELTGKPTIVRTPNWSFWKPNVVEDIGNKITTITAFEDDDFLNKLEDEVKTKPNRALLLTNQLNPLCEKESEETLIEISKIAEKYGLQVIIDDILRGTNFSDDRESIGIYFSTPIIIEGFSKRYGDLTIGNNSYVLFPRKEELEKYGTSFPPNEERYPGKLLELARIYSDNQTPKTLADRNQLFDSIFNKYNHQSTIHRVSESSIITRIQLPKNITKSPEYITSEVRKQNVLISPMRIFFKEYNPQQMMSLVRGSVPLNHEKENSLRISLGRTPKTHVSEAAKIIGETIEKLIE